MYHLSVKLSLLSHPKLLLSGMVDILLAGMFTNQILPLESLPWKVVGLEWVLHVKAEALGTETCGLYCVHQFTKLELFAVSQASQSEELMDEY